MQVAISSWSEKLNTHKHLSVMVWFTSNKCRRQSTVNHKDIHGTCMFSHAYKNAIKGKAHRELKTTQRRVNSDRVQIKLLYTVTIRSVCPSVLIMDLFWNRVLSGRLYEATEFHKMFVQLVCNWNRYVISTRQCNPYIKMITRSLLITEMYRNSVMWLI